MLTRIILLIWWLANYFKQNYPEIYKFRQKLYNREIFADTNVGDILFYRLDTWHRGTPVKKGKVRRSKIFYLRGLTGKKARIKEIRG